MSARALVAQRGTFRLEVPFFEADALGTAVLGPNGAGKTSLLLALQGLLPADGAVARSGRAAAVFARPAVLRGTALWNVAVVVRAVLGTSSDEAEQHARRALGDVGLAGRCLIDARRLSTGERQRVALARALACCPNVLYLDEPFANIDADARPMLRELVSSFRTRTGCCLVLATSFLADAAALCADVVVLEHGLLAYRGTTRELASAENAYIEALIAESRL